MNCRICRSETRSIGRALVLGKHRVEYFACETCGFVQTEEPHWLAEAYTEAITSQDIGLVGRNVQFAGLMRQVLPVFFDHHAQFVDYGGGYGMFVRLMRDYGFDFFRYDTYCQNIFAKGFEARDALHFARKSE